MRMLIIITMAYFVMACGAVETSKQQDHEEHEDEFDTAPEMDAGIPTIFDSLEINMIMTPVETDENDTDTETDENDTDTETQQDTQTVPDIDTETDEDTLSDTESDTETDEDTESEYEDTGTGAEYEDTDEYDGGIGDVDAGADSDIDSGIDTDTGGSDTASDTHIDTDMGVDTDTDSDTDVVDTDTGHDCIGGDIWYDNNTGLCWEKITEPLSRPWLAAEAYCSDMATQTGGDWRIPTIDELRTLVINCPQSESDGACPIVDGCDLACDIEPECDQCYGSATTCYLDAGLWPSTAPATTICGFYWSSSIAVPLHLSEYGTMVGQRWGVYYRTGKINAALYTLDTTTGNQTRCVR